MFESRISARAREKLLGREKHHAETGAWSYDMEGHAQKCVERYCELANKQTAIVHIFNSLLVCFQLQGGSELSGVCSQTVNKCLCLARIGRPDILWSVNKLARQSLNGRELATNAWLV